MTPAAISVAATRPLYVMDVGNIFCACESLALAVTTKVGTGCIPHLLALALKKVFSGLQFHCLYTHAYMYSVCA